MNVQDYTRKERSDPTWALIRESCKDDETKLVAQAISETADPQDLEDLFYYGLNHAVWNGSVKVSRHILEHGGKVSKIRPTLVLGPTGRSSKAMIELLLEHGWDINTPVGSCSKLPLMWHFTDNYDMVYWCLKQGAEVFHRDLEPFKADGTSRPRVCFPQILEKVARNGSVATFELLRSVGAPLGWRTLHFAAEHATHYHSGQENEVGRPYKGRYQERMAMVHHLVDTLGLDVNAPDQPVGSNKPDHWGTPLCYVARNPLEYDIRELTWYLLDHGADPAEAVEVAKAEQRLGFVRDVEEWTARRSKSLLRQRKCCVQ